MYVTVKWDFTLGNGLCVECVLLKNLTSDLGNGLQNALLKYASSDLRNGFECRM